MNRSLAAIVAVAIIISGCTTPAVQADVAVGAAPRAAADPATAAQAGAAINAFGLDLYRSVAAADAGTNVVVSPASVALALAMARAGARGETAAQMDAALRSVGSDANAGWLNALDAALASRNGTFKDDAGNPLTVTLRIANAPFAQRGMKLEPAYLDALSSRFGAGLRLVDYRADAEAARGVINGWVSDQTEARIPQLLARGTLDSLTRLVLVNAIYLKAPWQTAFDPTRTHDGAFTRADGSSVTVPTMGLATDLPYAAGSGWRAVELPYIGGSLALDVIVPEDLAAFERSLTADRLAAVTGALAARQVELTMPRFGIETQADLAATLAGLGMPLPFDRDRADFSGITPEPRIYIARVIHEANIDVDEKGTTAAAATAVVMRATGMPSEPVAFAVDHPFLFALRDIPTGTVLFLGRVADPTPAN